MQMPNTENLEIVADAIEASNTFNHQNFSHEDGAPSGIASHTVFLLDPYFVKFCNPFNFAAWVGNKYFAEMNGVEEVKDIKDEAAKILGLRGFEPGRLFSGYPPVKKEITKGHAALVLRNIAETGKVDWNIDIGVT